MSKASFRMGFFDVKDFKFLFEKLVLEERIELS